MDTNDLQDRASKLLRALEDGDANKARDMLHGEDALDVAMHLALVLAHAPGTGARTVKATLADVLAILAAERMARETLARTLGNTSGAHLSDIIADLGGLSGIIDSHYGIDRKALGDTSDTRPTATGIVRDLAALDHGRAVADLYASDEDVEARR